VNTRVKVEGAILKLKEQGRKVGRKEGSERGVNGV